MEQLLEWMEIIEDVRQHRKVRHSIKDILIIVLFATLANADTWEQIADFALWNEEYLRQYIELKNGVPSHDTIQRVMGMIRPESLQQLQRKWQELLDSNEGEKLKKTLISKMIESVELTNEEIRMFAGHEDFSTTAKFYNYSTVSWDKRTDAFERALG